MLNFSCKCAEKVWIVVSRSCASSALSSSSLQTCLCGRSMMCDLERGSLLTHTKEGVVVRIILFSSDFKIEHNAQFFIIKESGRSLNILLAFTKTFL